MAIKCNKCNRQITRSEDHITCSAQCGGNYHLFCVNLDEDTFNRLKKSKQISTWCCNLCGVNRIAGAASNVLDSLTSSSLSESCLEDMLHKVFSVYVDPIMVQLDTLNAQVTKLTAENKSLRDEVFSLNQVIRNTSQTGLSKLNEQDLNNKRSYAESLREKSAESIIVKPKDKEQSVTKTKSDVIRSIDALNSTVQIGKVKNLKEGAVLLGCKDVKELKKITKEKLSQTYEIKEVKPLKPRLRIVGISTDMNENDTLRFITKQNEFIFTPDSYCKILKIFPVKKKNEYSQVLLEVDYDTYKKALNIGHCMVGLDGCNIYDAVEIKRCYQCNGFNHTSKTCKSKEPSCPRCAESHLLKDCNAVELKCSNCAAFNRKNHNEDLNVGHAVWEYQKCISYQRMLEKIKQDVFVEVP